MGTAGGAEETQESTLNYCSARENCTPSPPKTTKTNNNSTNQFQAVVQINDPNRRLSYQA